MTSLITTYSPFISKTNFRPIICLLLKCSYAKKIESAGGISSLGKKKKMAKIGSIVEKKIIPVETDPHKLVNYVCGSNLLREGEDIKLKPDSEYPDWLWTLRTGKVLPLNKLEYNSKEYWRRIRKMGMRRNNQLSKLKKF
ncbi:hypothetical protein L9F63_013798 [Diploptera punctata]|uniref:Large ribosomal subunit protein mL54 n=1 Tax=Diploptera punctata TaxID=6984 RepID=A0AAD8A9G1_DIPPU|nr:hypothetical protein L9F63_013798 [Diploptera punctata]